MGILHSKLKKQVVCQFSGVVSDCGKMQHIKQIIVVHKDKSTFQFPLLISSNNFNSGIIYSKTVQ